MSGKTWREKKIAIQKEMQKYDKHFLAKEYAFNWKEKQYGEITMQNLAGAYVDYRSFPECVTFRTHWPTHDCIFFDNEKEMLVHKIKND
jgi:hypothetical protein